MVTVTILQRTPKGDEVGRPYDDIFNSPTLFCQGLAELPFVTPGMVVYFPAKPAEGLEEPIRVRIDDVLVNGVTGEHHPVSYVVGDGVPGVVEDLIKYYGWCKISQFSPDWS